ncbi:THO complex subunit 1, partial [Nannochloropsis gaditana CCMP526]
MVKHASTSEAFCPGDAEGAICRLEECIRGNYCKGTAGWGVVRETAHEVAVAEADRPVSHDTDLIEVAFRAVLAGIVQEALGKGEDVLDEEKFGLRALLDLALDLAQAGREEQGPGLGLRSVFFLLEDIFELLGVEQIQNFWPEVEKRESALFGLFKTARKSNLTMLKLCNSLLRKLSKGHNTAICGRIMMYLSRNWELSDPSAINKGGMANLSNKTAFEEPEDFARQQAR